MKMHSGSPPVSLAGIGAIGIALIVIVVGIAVILLIVDYTLSPDRLEITGPANLGPGGTGTFAVSVTFDEKTDRDRTLEVDVYEDDSAGNDLLVTNVLVTVPANANTGATSVKLDCTARGLEGRDGFSGSEDPHDLFVLYDRFFPLPNLTSERNVQTSCAAAPPPETPGGSGVGPGGEDR